MTVSALLDKPGELRDALEVQAELTTRISARSLADYLDRVVIDSRPEPTVWGRVIEPWQVDLVQPLIPALEHMAGLRPDYDGPRSFLYVLPKGHDKTGAIARLCNWAVAFSRKPLECVAAASTREQAGFLLEAMKAEIKLNQWLSVRLHPHNNVVRGEGGKLKVISADASHSSGLKSDLTVCDELTFWANRELFDMLYGGRAKRPASVFVIITNAGLKGSWQWEVLQHARERDAWHVYEAPIRTTLASWMTPADIEEIRSTVTTGHARRVLDNEWIDVTENPLLSFDLIETNVDESCLWEDGVIPPGRRPELYIGIDVGRTKDRTVIWTLELWGDIAWTREVLVMQDASFREQKSAILNRINRHVAGLRIDKGAIGYQLAEELEVEYPHIAEGVQLTQGRQGQLGMALKTAFESRRLRIPNDPELHADLQLVDEIDTGHSGLPVLQTNKGPSGHADRFWALALAYSAIPFREPRTGPRARPIGRTFG